MRTMISLRKDQCKRLCEVASRRGEKGFTHLIEEAVDRFLEGEDTQRRAIEDVFRSMGAEWASDERGSSHAPDDRGSIHASDDRESTHAPEGRETFAR